VSQERLPKCPLCFSGRPIRRLGAVPLLVGPPDREGRGRALPVLVSERRTMRASGFSQKLFLIAWAALGTIATIAWLYFIAISFRFIIDLL
jgi:hypothetical protein